MTTDSSTGDRATMRRSVVRGLGALAAGSSALDARLAFAADRASRAIAPEHEVRAAAATRDPFAFALLGDVPYNGLEARLLTNIFASFESDLAFAVHIGDIKGSWESCDDVLLDRRLGLLESSPVPLVYVPGDNEWTDCGAQRAGGFDPNERLAWLRARFFARMRAAAGAATARAGAAPVPFASIESQADALPGGPSENLRWRHHGVRFITLNVPGGNNGLDAEGLSIADWRRREAFNEQWLRDGYRVATADSDVAVIVIAHANPHFGRPRRRSGRRIDGYAAFRAQLVDASDAFAGPTLFVHGDTHHHRVEPITNKLLRVESYGSPFTHRWVRIDVDPHARDPFRITSRQAQLPHVEY